MGRGRVPGTRDRVHAAIQDAVDAAEQELEELRDGETESKLSILISGWGRGLAAALEELAVAVDELELQTSQAVAQAADEPTTEAVSLPHEGSSAAVDQADLEDADEGQLIEEARRSRAATAELREKGEEARRELPD
jgi:hypothetical protein